MEEHKYLRQSNNPGAIVNTDKKALEQYKARRNQSKEINSIKEEVLEVKQTMAKILQILESNNK